MSEALILEFAGLTEADYAAVNRELGLDMHTGAGDWPDGLISHAAGNADDGGFVVVEVWSSRAQQGKFMESQLGAALAAGGVTATPKVRWVPLLAHHLPGA